MYDYVCMAMYVWLCMYGYVCMAMYAWLCMFCGKLGMASLSKQLVYNLVQVLFNDHTPSQIQSAYNNKDSARPIFAASDVVRAGIQPPT